MVSDALHVLQLQDMGTYLKPQGRPTKFRKEFIEKMIDFFNVEPIRKEIMAESSKPNGEVSKTYKYVPNYLPTLIRFAKSIDVDFATVYRWSTKEELPENFKELPKAKQQELLDMQGFCNAYKHAKQAQEDFLIQGGLSGAMPASAFIFTAKNVSSMRDKVEQEIKITEVKPLLDNLRTKKIGYSEVETKVIDGKEAKVIESD